MSRPKIILERLSYTYTPPVGLPVRALEGVSLDISEDEFVALVGPSGCGKSTLLNAIADLLDPAECEVSGRIAVDGAEAKRRSRREANLGYVFQRDAYLQRRRSLIYDGRPPREPRQDEEPEKSRAGVNLARAPDVDTIPDNDPHD